MVLYICRECGKRISSGATRCPYCGAPPRPPLYGRPWSHRLALRALVILILGLPLFMLPVVLRWHNGSWNPCTWIRADALATQAAATAPATALAGTETAKRREAKVVDTPSSSSQCLRRWADRFTE